MFIDFLKDCIYFTFRERGREGEREGEKHRCARDTSISCLSHNQTEDVAHNPGMCPGWELNWQPFSSQAGAQSTEPQQPGLFIRERETERQRDRERERERERETSIAAPDIQAPMG